MFFMLFATFLCMRFFLEFWEYWLVKLFHILVQKGFEFFLGAEVVVHGLEVCVAVEIMLKHIIQHIPLHQTRFINSVRSLTNFRISFGVTLTNDGAI
jgi:hypothetical protein